MLQKKITQSSDLNKWSRLNAVNKIHVEATHHQNMNNFNFEVLGGVN